MSLLPRSFDSTKSDYEEQWANDRRPSSPPLDPSPRCTCVCVSLRVSTPSFAVSIDSYSFYPSHIATKEMDEECGRASIEDAKVEIESAVDISSTIPDSLAATKQQTNKANNYNNGEADEPPAQLVAVQSQPAAPTTTSAESAHSNTVASDQLVSAFKNVSISALSDAEVILFS